MRGFWMLVDAAVFAVACAVLVSMPQVVRPQHSLESVALSTALEDIALAASSQPELVASACESTDGEIVLREKFQPVASTFSADDFLVHCPNGKTFSLSEDFTAASVSSNSISTNRVIVPKDGRAFLAVFEARLVGG